MHMATNLLQKSAHVAVGIPVSAAKSMMEKAREVRTELSKSGDKLSADLHTRFEQWVEEGEKLVDSLIGAGTENVDKVVDLTHRTEDFAHKTAETVKAKAESTATKTTETARAFAKGVTEPRVAVTDINGIGPATAKKLAKAGVTTIIGFLERTDSQKDTATLAEQTGISVEQLGEWRTRADLTQIKGIGQEHQTLLHAAKIGTIETLAAMSVSEIDKRFAHLEKLGFDQIPSTDVTKGWIAQARKLVG
jgi:predicted flap endonuclease-1-like 5' DNA nuclease